MSETKLYQCRLCLKNSQFCYSLFDEEVTEVIESFTSIKIDEEDNLPSICCSQCLQDIHTVQKIRTRIIESDSILRQKRMVQTYESACELTETVKIEAEQYTFEDDSSEFVNKSPEAIKMKLEDQLDHKSQVTINPKLNAILRMRINGKDPTCHFKCGECNSTFQYKEYYLQHKKKHDRISVCNICGRQVLTINYQRHLSSHKADPKICELCGAVAKNAESLRGHMFYMHKSTADKYQCKHCNKFYRYKYKYLLHIRKAHGGAKTHICEVCAKEFYTARDVKRHIEMTHMKLRPYICEYCNKGFSSSYARRTHVRQHTNEKPFKCDVCAEGFRQRVSLRTHLKSKHNIMQKPEPSSKNYNVPQEQILM